jgi:hypothetical protein
MASMTIMHKQANNILCDYYHTNNLHALYSNILSPVTQSLHELFKGTVRFVLDLDFKTEQNVLSVKHEFDTVLGSNSLIAVNTNGYGIHLIYPDILLTPQESSSKASGLKTQLAQYSGNIDTTIYNKILRTIYSNKLVGSRDVYVPFNDPLARRDANTLVRYSIYSSASSDG